MLMDQPQNAEAPTAGPDATPEARRALGYNAMARLAGADCARFVATARYLKGCGLAAPEILAADVAQGFLVLEDLGDDLYTDVIAKGGDERAMYQAAIEALARLHAKPAPAWLTRRQTAVRLRRDGDDRRNRSPDRVVLAAGAQARGRRRSRRRASRVVAGGVAQHRRRTGVRASRLSTPRTCCGATGRRASRASASSISRMRSRAHRPTTSSRCWKMRAATCRRSWPRR